MIYAGFLAAPNKYTGQAMIYAGFPAAPNKYTGQEGFMREIPQRPINIRASSDLCSRVSYLSLYYP
jgi:hypothetical protein